MRVCTLWRVPVFCLFASLLSYWLTVFAGPLFYVNRVANADGSIEVSVDPLRGTLFKIVLFLLVLLLGGLWAFRSMTRREIACSAALLILPMLAVVLAQLWVPSFPLKVSVFLSPFYNWSGSLSSLLMRCSLPLPAATIIAQFAPLLFVPFGRRQA